MRLLTVILVMTCLLLGCGDDPVATTDGPPTVSGVVTDSAGDPVVGASVTLVFGIDNSGLPDWDKVAKRPRTEIQFVLSEAGFIHFEVQNYVGNTVKVLLDGELAAGEHAVMWDATDENEEPVSPGLYFYEWRIGETEPQRSPLLYFEAEPDELVDRAHAVTDSEGRYEIETNLFPIGEMLQTTDESGGDTGMKPISNRVKFYALLRNGSNVSVVSQFAVVDPDRSQGSIDLQF